MKLHIVIPIIDQIELTKEAIESINSRYEYAIHIIDQDSNQVTQNWLQSWQDSQRKWVHRYSPKVSLAEAWNRGIKESLSDPECKYVFVINNDVIFHKQTVDNLIDSLEHTGYAMVTCNNIAPLMTVVKFKDIKINDDPSEDLKPITNWREEGPDFSGFMINRQTIEDVGWFDENFTPAYYEDNDYHTRILKAGKHAKRIARAPFYHYGSKTAQAIGAISSPAKFIEKWGVMPEKVMDGQGYQNPYNGDKDYKYWKGVEKYEKA